ncbi:sigma-70 family RNA polymerase sigma factor [Roseivivax sediminis]|uniref:RNA polymerase sigma-70 factor, ECF subfamily n=1 Tax=Roseivivax sediminis TaxID=936889 RepID=A0A1I2CPU1_9RHOB|nr:sigma-70 family RNA polymerase sigma factor [Roseivivax sediminis]SFE70367.1 RNA polymerase sigma-70 factor, ECF subfamily [Roseivivax sediminis]
MQETKWLIAREIPRLRRYALALTRDPVLADDLVQDTLERAIRKRHLWRRKGSLRGWLYKILYRVFLNQRTQRWRRAHEVDLNDAPELADTGTPETQLAQRDIVNAMQDLPVEQRAAIALTAIEGLSYDEAAAVLSIPIGTLRSRLSRGRERLRETFDTSEPHLRQVK